MKTYIIIGRRECEENSLTFVKAKSYRAACYNWKRSMFKQYREENGENFGDLVYEEAVIEVPSEGAVTVHYDPGWGGVSDEAKKKRRSISGG